MSMIIKRVEYNYHQGGNLRDGTGEDYHFYEVGAHGVECIYEDTENGKWSYLVILNGDRRVRIFNPCKVYYEGETETQ